MILNSEMLEWRDSRCGDRNCAAMFRLERLAAALEPKEYPQDKINQLWMDLHDFGVPDADWLGRVAELTSKTVNRCLKYGADALAVVNVGETTFSGAIPLPPAWGRGQAVLCNEAEMPVWQADTADFVQLAIAPFDTLTLRRSGGKPLIIAGAHAELPLLPETLFLRENLAGAKKAAVRLSALNLQLAYVKKAETSADLIVKVINPTDAAADGTLTVSGEVTAACRSNVSEDQDGDPLPLYGNKALLHLLSKEQLVLRFVRPE